MIYNIGEISDMFELPISTLRYYDKEGFFPHLERVSGIRKFTDREVETLRMIECLKKSGLEIKDIQQFILWCNEGSSTYPQRKELFESRKKAVEAEIASMQKALAMLEFKCWYYEKAMEDGNEDALKKMIPDHLPEGIQELYDKAHE